ncbi:MAG: MATE family efflux transporter [Desulfurococcaceae archaeon]
MSSDIGVVDKYRDKVLNGPVGEILLWLGLPLMAVQLVHVSYNIADTYWLSRYSEVAYAAPRQIWPFFMFLNAIVHGIATANMALISQSIGARDYEYSKKIISYFISTILLVNTATTTVFIVLGPLVFRYVMNTPPGLYNYVVIYASIISIDLFLSGIYISYGTMFQAMGDTRTPSRAGVVSALLNIILDPFFIFGLKIKDLQILPGMGVAGAALATVISRFIGLIVVLSILYKRYPFLKPSFIIKVDKNWLYRSVKIGLPVSLMMMSNSLAFMFQNRLINTFGEYVAAAAAIGFVLMDLADAALWGFTSSVSTMVGQAIGANLEKRARNVGKKALLYIGLSSFMGSLIVLLFRNQFIGIFTNVPEIVMEADTFVQLFAPTLALFAVFFIGMAIGRGSGHTLYPTILGIFRLWGIRLGLGYVLAIMIELGTIGLWISMSLSNLIAGLLIIPWVLRGKWTVPVVKRQEQLVVKPIREPHSR